MEIEEVGRSEALPLLSLNHISLLVKCVWTSARFYEDVLGFLLVKRPSSFKFRGAWLYNYGIGIHLLETESVDNKFDDIIPSRPINPKHNHISFQCTDVELVKMRLAEMGVEYVSGGVEDEGIKVDQVFFHDPDGYMVELCNCENLPVLPVSSYPSTMLMKKNHIIGGNNKEKKKMGASNKCGLMEEAIMMESLSMEMMNFSF